MTKKLPMILLVELILCALALSGPLPQTAQAADFSNPAFRNLWNRTDGENLDKVGRPLFWGASIATLTERYDGSPGNKRAVQYFDKGRMEVTHPEGDATNLWYVSSGLLVRDMVGGIVQIGDNTAQAFDRVTTPVAGDDTNPLATTPYYGDFFNDAFSGTVYRSQVGLPVSRTIRRGGQTGLRASSAQPKINVGYYDSTSHHNIAGPFWDLMNATGPVNTPGDQVVNGRLSEWQYLLGFPLTEAYWITARVEGKSQELLIQLFQRRVLIYNPAAQTGKQVEFTNVGRHWYNWQYGPPPVVTGDTSLPASINATITPTVGDTATLFRFTATGFTPGEKVSILFTQPDGTVLTENDFNGLLTASGSGQIKGIFQGSDLATDVNQGLGIYKLELHGQSGGATSVVYWRIIPHVAITPTTPYNVDNSPAPTSINGAVEPGSGPRNTTFTAFVFGFQLKDIVQNKVGIWTTSPEGVASGVDPATSELFLSGEEALDGTGLVVSAPPYPGVWAITFAEKANPTHQAILYFKVTDAPPQLTIGAALRLFTRGTTSSLTPHQGWLPTLTLKIPRLQTNPVPVQPDGGDNGDN